MNKIITAAEAAEHYAPLGKLWAAYKRIEELETALRAILDVDADGFDPAGSMSEIAQRALGEWEP